MKFEFESRGLNLFVEWIRLYIFHSQCFQCVVQVAAAVSPYISHSPFTFFFYPTTKKSQFGLKNLTEKKLDTLLYTTTTTAAILFLK